MGTKTLITVALCGVLAATGAQSEGGQGGERGGTETSEYDLTFNDLVTGSVSRDLDAVRVECMAAARVYRLDCVRQGIDLTSRRIPFHGEYGQIREALRESEASFADIVDLNADRTQERMVVPPGTNPRFKARRYYTPVAQSGLDRAKTQALGSLDQTEARLLKTGDATGNATKTYAAVSSALAALADVMRR
ncbi:hypothetical protein MRBLMR1_005917 [Neorhizobium sp. LMR1-1-1.1]